MSSFLSKLLISKQATFTEREIKILELNFSLQPLLGLVNFQKEIDEREIMEKLGYFISESIISHFKKRFAIERENLANLWINLFDINGFGKLEFIESNNERTIAILEDNNFARLYLEKYGKQKKPVCHIIIGILKNFVENTTGRKVEAKETSCIAMGNRVCTFEINAQRP
jgi:predicted hydrocarbon binding protein